MVRVCAYSDAVRLLRGEWAYRPVRELEIHPLLAIFTVMVGRAVGGIMGIYLSGAISRCPACRLAQILPKGKEA